MNLEDAYQQALEVIAARYEDRVRRVFEEIKYQFGPTLKGIYNSQWVRVYKELIVPNIDIINVGLDAREAVKVINEDKLCRNGLKEAEKVVAVWRGKIASKVGELVEVEVHAMSWSSFRITGIFNDHHVCIEQQMIVNVSSLGKLFNQFPAHIYVDGKVVNAKAYKELTKNETIN
jgi:hypothetical protein